MEAIALQVASNPLTFSKLLETLAFQVGALGLGTITLSVFLVPYLERLETSAMLDKKKTNRFLKLLIPYLGKGVAFIFLTGTLAILLTDVGWPKAIQQFGLPNALLFARASGAPNGAHLLSYIPLPILGLYVAWKYRKDNLLDCYQGILLVGFGVAFHELPWLIAYWVAYAQYWNLGVLSNIVEDFGFAVMCIMLIVAYWKYPHRSVPMNAFALPLGIYAAFLAPWLAEGLPVAVINNWQLGQGIYMTTQWWGDPAVNLIEIASWVLVAAMFFVVVRYQSKKVPA